MDSANRFGFLSCRFAWVLVGFLWTRVVFVVPCAQVSTVSVSGISSGADAAVQLQIVTLISFEQQMQLQITLFKYEFTPHSTLQAFSSEIFGSAIFAGQAYHCAVQRFPDDELSHVRMSQCRINCDHRI